MKLVRFVGVLALLVIIVAIAMVIVSMQFGPAPQEPLPGRFKGRVLAMEFVANPVDIEGILKPDVSHNRDVMRNIILLDFLWIACYGLLFVAIGLLLRKRNCPWARYLGTVAIVAGLAAAAFDVRENLAILKALNCLQCDQQLVNEINDAALLKWTMSFVAMALLAIAFQDIDNRWAHWIGISFIVTALVGFVGLWRYQLLGLIPIPLLIGLILLAIVATIWPRRLTENIS
ncbi:MAG TPA: hypothetical protein VJM50_19180 [Pyrinomonadaceae bacterium]|nr:hypothetical protein [Pyrinomonadaceae bacterium]